MFCPIQQIVGDSLMRILRVTDSETAAIQTCLDTAYIVSPPLLLPLGLSEPRLTAGTNLDRMAEAFSNLKHGGGVEMHGWAPKRVFQLR